MAVFDWIRLASLPLALRLLRWASVSTLVKFYKS